MGTAYRKYTPPEQPSACARTATVDASAGGERVARPSPSDDARDRNVETRRGRMCRTKCRTQRRAARPPDTMPTPPPRRQPQPPLIRHRTQIAAKCALSLQGKNHARMLTRTRAAPWRVCSGGRDSRARAHARAHRPDRRARWDVWARPYARTRNNHTRWRAAARRRAHSRTARRTHASADRAADRARARTRRHRPSRRRRNRRPRARRPPSRAPRTAARAARWDARAAAAPSAMCPIAPPPRSR